MRTKVEKAIADYGMLNSGDSVLVGLSGGADSVALLLILTQLGYDVSACHINHQLRGDESDRDENYCRELCNRLNIRLFVEKIDVITYCNENKYSIEEGARYLRYQIFKKYSENLKIATAHTLSDSLETTLFNLTRGAALKGLCGIPPMRENIIRPIIYCTRQEIEQYLKQKNQDYVTDSTNLSNEYTRNKIRLDVIPKLLEINASLYSNYLKTFTLISNDNRCLDDKASELLNKITCGENEYEINELLNEDFSISSRCIALILKKNNLEYNFDRINSIYEMIKNNGKINLKKDVYATSNKGKLKIQTILTKEINCFCEELIQNKEYYFINKIIKTNVVDINYYNKNRNVNKLFANCVFDYDKIQGKAVIRNRNNGDRIKFLNKNHTTSIKKLFNSQIPLKKREEVVFVADESGPIYVEGFGISERVSIDDNTKNVIVINILQKDE